MTFNLSFATITMATGLFYSQVGRQALTRDVKALAARLGPSVTSPAPTGRAFGTAARAATRVLAFGDFVELPWANGKGSSYEILSDRRDGVWTYRVALAPVEESGDWSTLPGVDRSLVVVQGAGFDLAVDDGGVRAALPCAYGDVVHLRGDATTTCVLREGAAVDLGVMTYRDCGYRTLVTWHAVAPAEATPFEEGLAATGAPSIDLPPADVIFAAAPGARLRKDGATRVLGTHGALVLGADDREAWALKEGAVTCIRIDTDAEDTNWDGNTWNDA